jgi:hypothetical protein
MSIGYFLVNYTKREWISFLHVNASTAKELAGNSVPAAITTWYMLQNCGDAISFVSDTYDDWPFSDGQASDIQGYIDCTDKTVNELIQAGIVQDHGILWADADDQHSVYVRDLRNIWTVPD